MEHVTAQGFTDRARVGIMPIGPHPFWAVAHDVDSLRRSKRLAASMSRFSLSIESTKLPSRSSAPFVKCSNKRSDGGGDGFWEVAPRSKVEREH